MSRVARKDLGSPFLHVMVQGVNKEYIFFNNDYIERYLEIIERYRYDFEFTIIAYCIMNNHAHFLIYAKDIAQFGKFMQKVNLTYAQFYNRKQHRCGIL
ncbi:MAG: transposase [Clostridia bacterium]|nr:transposase [Clostridia bacterium]